MAVDNQRRQNGSETGNRLLYWANGQTASERLASTLLQTTEGYQSDPAHPQGGRDGKADALLKKDGLTMILAAYFPRGPKKFLEIKKKFKADLAGVKSNNAKGMVFFTNQELRLSERPILQSLAGKDIPVEIYHLERVRGLLDIPRNYGLRLEYLQISITTEEQLALYADRDEAYLQRLKDVTSALDTATRNIVGQVSGGDSFPIIRAHGASFALEVEGEFPLRGLVIRIFDKTAMDAVLKDPILSTEDFFTKKRSVQLVETRLEYLRPRLIQVFWTIPEMTDGEIRSFHVEVESLNGSVTGVVYIYRVATNWGSHTSIDCHSCTLVQRNGQSIFAKDSHGRDVIFNDEQKPTDWWPLLMSPRPSVIEIP